MRQNYSNLRTKLVRFFLLCCVALTSTQLFAVGWTPTDGGLLVNLEQGDRFLLSVMIDDDNDPSTPDVEYFVCNYPGYTGGHFGYSSGAFLKLIPQDAGATKPSDASEWSVGAPLNRKSGDKDYNLGGIVYTMWNGSETRYTLRTENNHYKFFGDLTDNYNHNDACDVVFVVPTNRKGIVSFDPERTMGRGEVSGTDELGVNKKGRFNGETGTGFLGMTYREVYWLEIPKSNDPRSYTNAALVTFNTTTSNVKWHAGTINPGKAAYAYADNTSQKPHHKTKRTIFRLYVLNDPINTCGSYFFATDVQDFVKYRKVNDPSSDGDWTTPKKIYTWDHLFCMERVGDASSKIYKTGWMKVPADDSTYYYVGKNNTYVNRGGAVRLDPTDVAVSQFKNIDSLRVDGLKAVTTAEGKPFIAPAGAYGRMVVDTSSTKQNLGVSFEPAGYFLQVQVPGAGFTNVQMKQTGTNEWTSEEMWTIHPAWASYTIKATLMTGSEFSPTDPGVDIAGWSSPTVGTSIPVHGSSESVEDKSGWARIYTNNAGANGAMEFFLANKDTCIHYDNNGFHGMQIPNQHPIAGQSTVTVEDARLKADFTFTGWNTKADGSGVTIAKGTTIDFRSLPTNVTMTDGVVTLYAQATYNGTYNVALSFMEGGQRYFMTYPGEAAPRFSRARHYDDWTNVLQGMANAENTDPNYINTFKIMTPTVRTGGPLADGEHCLDPKRELVKGYEDSLMFYEYFSPASDEYLGLYYDAPNTVVANNTWAGLFVAEKGSAGTVTWPDYKTPTVKNVKLKSEYYVTQDDTDGATAGDLKRVQRGNHASGTYIKYIPSTDQFDGVTDSAQATKFQISTVVVADAHYIVQPDNSEDWRDEIVFGYHVDEQTTEDVWSKLFGKQLMAAMIIDEDTIYFHPNRDKIINDPNALYLSKDFRVSQAFELIHDSRVSAPLNEGDSVRYEPTDYYWHNEIISGNSSPINVKDGEDHYIDVVDTFRVTLSHGGISKIKEYRGIWKTGADGLHVSADGSSRYRDVIIRTKAYHYGEEVTKYVIRPAQQNYTFNPFANQSQQLDFTLSKVVTRQLLDAEGNQIGEVEVIKDSLMTDELALAHTYCTLKNGSTYFTIDAEYTATDHVTLKTVLENSTAGENIDTLTISGLTVTMDDGTHDIETVRVPLMQTSMVADELVWSVDYEGRRIYILAGSDGLIFRTYKRDKNTLYKLNTSTPLVRGSYDPANSDAKYITPWKFSYSAEHKDQLALKTLYGVNRHLKITGSSPSFTATLNASDSSFLTYHYVNVITNSNANEEELVKLQYGGDANGWLQFNGTSLVLTTEDKASTFSWSYLEQEYNLLNDGTYPDHTEAEFDYNSATAVAIKTKYKAYREYSMLVGNQLTYLCREEEKSIANLINASGDWKTNYSITRIPDARTFDTGASTTSSGLGISTEESTLKTTITPASATSPTDVKIGGTYVNIVDTLDVQILRRDGAPTYRFAGDWSKFSSVSDAHLKLTLIRKTYHNAPFDSLFTTVVGDQYTYTFPADVTAHVNDSCIFDLGTIRRRGTHTLDVEGNSVASTGASVDSTHAMHLNNISYAEVRLADEYGNTPNWCEIEAITAHTITVRCKSDGIRSPRSAYIYLAYIIYIDPDDNPATKNDPLMRFVTFRLMVSQASLFKYANNQHLVHSRGASGDDLDEKGMQRVHENRHILYYYPDQDTELPIRERSFYGWWRWYQEGEGEIGDSDIPNEKWRVLPQNTGRYNYPYRIIGDSVWTDDTKTKKKLVTQGRYTVFHYKSKDYNNKANPPANSPRVAPPTGKAVVTYVADLSNYYDNLPLSMKNINQVDTAVLDTIKEIIEPTLSLREVFELHPWTEMAARMESYKTRIPDGEGYHTTKVFPLANENYMEDHVMMAPIGNRLLLMTEQRYNNENLKNTGHSESLLGYYMRDDNWSSMSSVVDGDGWSRQDSMIWCGGWDAECKWYTYNQKTQKYTPCNHSITQGDDFLSVPAKPTITIGHDFDTVFYCLRARSWSSQITPPAPPAEDEPDSGAYMFNICRYKIIYHRPQLYGPLKETTTGLVTSALITNDEIEQRYEVLERLDFDYIRPGRNYNVYPHPLPWADASYGYTYPLTASLPQNRYHDESDFPNHGEYGLINRIPYSSYWNKMEQHGGAANGYMIYCDGMSSSGQVAALSLETNLCAGQKMYFSGYVGNPSSQTNKSNPNFIFSVQGSTDGSNWDDITSYMTGDIKPSNQWYQIYFPIVHNREGSEQEYSHFRVRIYNVSNSFDGNDFIIDDMCIFATKPPLMAYQAQTTCKEYGADESDTHILLRIDYQGITGEGYNGDSVCYTVEKLSKEDEHVSYVTLTDGYLAQRTKTHIAPATEDTVFGKIYIPEKGYEPSDPDSIFRNMNELLEKNKEMNGEFREGYIYEILEGNIRPVKYVVHKATMDSRYNYKVRVSLAYNQLMSSICAMTSRLKISSRMVLELNGEEQPETEQVGLCANSTYDINLLVKGAHYRDSVAPIDVQGSCINDWLLYGDTADHSGPPASTVERYGYKYSDIRKIITEILRYDPKDGETNENQFAASLNAINKNVMERVRRYSAPDLETTDHPYDVIVHLVNGGFLTLYKSNMTVSVKSGDSVQYIIFPIVGTGSESVKEANVDICPNPIFIKLKPSKGGDVPLIVGGVDRPATDASTPVQVLVNEHTANTQFKLHVDSIMPLVGIHSVELRSTDDPDYLEGVHILQLTPDKRYPSESYYTKNTYITFTPSSTTTYRMRAGYNYTFNIIMQTYSGSLTSGDCEVGTVPFTVSVVPDHLRWDPKSASDNRWNNPDNWLAIDENNDTIKNADRFAPLTGTALIIPAMTAGLPYPKLPDNTDALDPSDSVKQAGFTYNTCDVIRFMPGAAIAQQQWLTYSRAVIDMAMPHNKWAFRAAPVKGMLSGDIFMADADNANETPLWEVGDFDANGRAKDYGNASFWLSLYSRTTQHLGNTSEDNETRTAAAEWSKVTNAMTLSLPPASGWAVFTRTSNNRAAAVRLPKEDDIYYYYTRSGDKMYDSYEQNLQALREEKAVEADALGHAGELAFHPAGGATYQVYTLTNGASSTSFVFGNPTMGYIDIWGFIADNRGEGTDTLAYEISYMDESGASSIYTTVSQKAAEATDNVITNPKRYLPPMHAMVIKAGTAALNRTVRVNANRIVTDPTQIVRAAPARLQSNSALRQGIMTITAINPVSDRAISHLLLGQGYQKAIVEGEDAILTTVNISKYSATSTPTTPFNLYAVEDTCGLSIDLLDSIVNVPLSFYMSNLPFDTVTQLWFTGVNSIDGPLVLYDALTNTERLIADGLCLSIETPSDSHLLRYYIRRPGYSDEQPIDPIATAIGLPVAAESETVVKVFKDGNVYIIRNGHIYTMLGQKVERVGR